MAAPEFPKLLGNIAGRPTSDVTGIPAEEGTPFKGSPLAELDASPAGFSPSDEDLSPGREGPPEGHRVLAALTLLPLGGVFWEVFLLVTDLGLDSVQIGSFVLKEDYWFAAQTFGFVSCTVLIQSYHLSPLRWPAHAAKSVKLGALTDELAKVFVVERAVEAPASMLVIPYGMLLMEGMPTLSGVVSVLSLLASIRAIAAGIAQDQDSEGGKYPLGASAVLRSERPGALLALRGAVVCSVAADVVVFAVMSLCLHPAFAALALLATHLLAALERDSSGLAEWILLSRYMWPAGFSSFGLRVGSVEPINAPARLRLLYMAVRPLACILLICAVDFNADYFASFPGFDRKMGRTVLCEQLLAPIWKVLTCLAAQEWPSQGEDGRVQVGPELFTLAALGYRAALASILAVALPVSVVARGGLALYSPFAADGSVDGALNARVSERTIEIKRWTAQRKFRLGDVSACQMLSESLLCSGCCA